MSIYQLEDPRPIALNAPYTFFLPFEGEIAAVGVGDLAKLCFLWDEPWDRFSGERMWVCVTNVEGDVLTGTLDNEPSESGKMTLGDVVVFNRHHVIDILWNDAEQTPDRPSRREYWERCLVDAEVLNGEARVEYLYREAPDMTQEGDTYPDSGWRIRGAAAFADEGGDENVPEYVALGAVLNRDDRWLELIDKPVGSRFSLDLQTNEFVPV